MQTTALNRHGYERAAGALALIAALASAGCSQESNEALSSVTGNIIADVKIAEARILFVDEGGGDVGVAELSRTGRVSVIMPMIRAEHATPLEIFLATAAEGEDAPEILVENHRHVAELQGRARLEPQDLTAFRPESGPPKSALAGTWTNYSISCTANGWEGAAGTWGSYIVPSLNIFTNTTAVRTNTTTYPDVKSITQLAAWNANSGSFHTHGMCLADDTGADGQINFQMLTNNNVVLGFSPVYEDPNQFNALIYEDYVATGVNTTSRITNANSSAATFRHSAAAWVPFPG